MGLHAVAALKYYFSGSGVVACGQRCFCPFCLRIRNRRAARGRPAGPWIRFPQGSLSAAIGLSRCAAAQALRRLVSFWRISRLR